MQQFFDAFGFPESPSITLCNPDGTELYSLGIISNRKLTLRFNALSELTFEIPYKVNEVLTEYYPLVLGKRLIYLTGYGWFKIEKVEETDDGIVKKKSVSCSSIETDLIKTRIVSFGGTYKFYDFVSPGSTLIGYLLTRLPKWSIGHIDTSLTLKYRSFDIADTNAYSFMMTDVEEAYGCVFQFDFDTYIINAYDVENSTTETDIFLSYDNLIKDSSFSEITDEIVTCLNVYGGGDLDIRGVNPLGTAAIYNFDYFKNTDWMSTGLISAIDAWEEKIEVQRPIYSAILLNLKNEIANNIFLEGELADLQSEYTALETVLKVQIEGGQETEETKGLMDLKQDEIDAKQAEITNSDVLIQTYRYQLLNINALLSFPNNFTSSQRSELDSFTYENTYQNENIIQTDSMTDVEIQEAAETLYEQGVSVLGRVSQPRYEFSITASNFVFLEEYSEFTSQLEVGSEITIQKEDGVFSTVVLLEISLNFDNPTEFSLTFSNRLRLDNGSYVYSDLMGQTVRNSSTVSFDSAKWSNWSSDYKEDVTTFITSALDASKNELINSSGQEITINTNGLKGKRLINNSNPALGYDQRQVWLTSNTLAFTNDGFSTVKLALGEIDLFGRKVFGLASDALIGNIIVGNELNILSEDGVSFTFNADGANLYNAKFVVSRNNSEIHINNEEEYAGNPFLIRTNTGTGMSNKFWVDSGGNVNVVGRVTATGGTFGGWSLAADGLYSSGNVYYLKPDGNAKLGGLLISPTGGDVAGRGKITFSGDIYANGNIRANGDIYATRLFGRVVNDSNIVARTPTGGGISGNNIFGGIIKFPGVDFGQSGAYGYAYMAASADLTISAGSNAININQTPINWISINSVGSLWLQSPDIIISAPDEGDLVTLECDVLKVYTTNPADTPYSDTAKKLYRLTTKNSLGTTVYLEFVNGILTYGSTTNPAA